jgi:OPT family oligopeptide transporter
MSTQLIGFSIGGICKSILVTPPSMIWPFLLAYAAIFNTLHSQETTGTHASGGISRARFFTYVFVGYFLYSQFPSYIFPRLGDLSFLITHIVLDFFPSYLFTALSYFSWVCWIVPNNVKINQLFGVTNGLAMGLITFDWGQIIAFNGSPLLNPWWSAANVGFAVIFFYWILLPILYVSSRFSFLSSHLIISRQYSNTWYSAYLPLISSQAFDNAGNIYNLTRVINPDGSFNFQAYQAYSPLFLPASFAVLYGLSFASITALIVHTFLYNCKTIWIQSRCSLQEQPDIHARLMSVYKEIPNWWYMLTFCACINHRGRTCL